VNGKKYKEVIILTIFILSRIKAIDGNQIKENNVSVLW
jgi:hypothetical protein